MRPRPHTLAVLVVALSLAAACAVPVLAQQPAPLPDSQIQALISHQLNDKKIAVRASVSGGVVTLDGMVRSLWEKEEAIDIARKAHDVQKVISNVTIARAESDKAIADKITDQVQRYVFYTVFDNIEMNVLNGVVTMMGQVTMPSKSSDMANLVSRVQGVQRVDNKIEVLPASPIDDHLRMAVASQIYRDPMFWNYSMQVNPPIHVIVDNGKVTLVGVVNTELEKQKAEMIARTTFGVFSVTNQLRVERGSN